MCAANALSFSSPPLSFPPPPLKQKTTFAQKGSQQDLSCRQAGDQGPQRDSPKVTPYPLPDQRPYHLATKSGLYCVTGGVGVWPPPPPAVIAAAAATTADAENTDEKRTDMRREKRCEENKNVLKTGMRREQDARKTEMRREQKCA